MMPRFPVQRKHLKIEITKDEISFAEKVYLETPLYEKIEFSIDTGFNKERESQLIEIYNRPIDIFCPGCNNHSIFHRDEEEESNYESFVKSGQQDQIEKRFNSNRTFSTLFKCTRDLSHIAIFQFIVSDDFLMKIGQYPSLADLQMFDMAKYRSVLGKTFYPEFTKSIGLSAHGVGVGSFVYLRRIFENLIEEARQEQTANPEWDEDVFQNARMDKKIKLLKNELPEFLVENQKPLYGYLSKGIHELSEQECLAAFPVMKNCIELILDQRITKMEKDRKIKETAKTLQDLGGSHEK